MVSLERMHKEHLLRGTAAGATGFRIPPRIAGEVHNVVGLFKSQELRELGDLMRLYKRPGKFKATQDELYRKGMTEAQKAGLRYEAQVKNLLAAEWEVFAGIRFAFFNGKAPMHGIPDFFILDWTKLRCWLFEIKAQHSMDGFIQLEVYKRVLKAWLPKGWGVETVEICHTFRPEVLLPVERHVIPFEKGMFKTLDKATVHRVVVVGRPQLRGV